MSYKFIHGDCLDEKNYPKEKVDFIIFDPPFKPKEKQYKQMRDNTTNYLEPILTPDKEYYPQWWETLMSICKKYLKSTGWICFKADSFTAHEVYDLTCSFFEYHKDVGLISDNGVLWDKGKIGGGFYIRGQHERIEVYFPKLKSKEKRYWKIDVKKRKKLSTFKNLSGEIIKHKENKWHGGSKEIAFPSVIRVPNFNSGTLGAKQQKHINETPKEVWIPFVDFMCPINGIVLDLTMGTGSIALAVEKLNRKKGVNRSYWGIEITNEIIDDKDCRYVYHAKKKLKQLQKKSIL